MRYLIIGGDSRIGQELNRKLKGKVYTTGKKNKSKIFLDLKNPDMKHLPPVDIAFMCAAMTNKKECEENKEYCFRINVTNTLYVCKDLLDVKTKIVFLSSDEVFGNSYYGYTKKCAEKGLNLQNVSIIRLSKIITKNFPLLKDWYTKLKDDISLVAFSNLFVSPIYEDYAINSIISLANMKSDGIFPLSASNNISYSDIAYHMADRLRKPYNLITTAKYKNTNNNNIVMNTKYTAKLLKSPVPSPYDAIDKWIEDYENQD